MLGVEVAFTVLHYVDDPICQSEVYTEISDLDLCLAHRTLFRAFVEAKSRNGVLGKWPLRFKMQHSCRVAKSDALLASEAQGFEAEAPFESLIRRARKIFIKEFDPPPSPPATMSGTSLKPLDARAFAVSMTA